MKKSWPWLFGLLAATGTVFGSVLFGGRLFSGLYVNLYHYFFFAGQKHLVFDLHQFPSWWSSFYSGYPISLTLDGFLNPIFLVALWKLPVIDAYHWLTVAFFLANIWACYVFARALKMTPAAAFFAAVTYGFSGIIIRWTDVIVFTALFPILPLSFLACLRIQEGKRGWRWVFLALLVYGWIGGFAELVVYDLLALAGWCLYLLLREKPRPPLRKIFWDGCKKYLFPVLGSVLVVSPWLISVLYFIKSASSRGAGLALDQSSSMPLGISHLIHMVLPRLSVTYGGNLPVLNLGDDIDLYLGTTAVLLLLIIPFVWRSMQRGWLFFLGLLTFAVLMAFRSPLYLLLHNLPVINLFRWHFKWLFLATFAAALLAGYALDAVSAFRTQKAAKPLLIILWVGLALLLIGSSIMGIAGPQIAEFLAKTGETRYIQAAVTAGRALPSSADYYSWIIRRMSNSLVSGLSITNLATAWALACWVFALIVFTLTVRAKVSLSFLRRSLVVVGLLSTTVWAGFLVGFPRSYLTETPATAAFIQEREAGAQPYRIYDYFPQQSVSKLQDTYRIDLTEHDNRALLSREILGENIHAWFGIDAAFDHEPLSVMRLAQLITRITGSEDPAVMKSVESQIVHFSTTPTAVLLGTANVKYVLTPFELGSPWKLVYTSSVLEKKIPVYVYENPFFLPRFGFADIKTITNDTMNDVMYAPGKLLVTTHTQTERRVIFRETSLPFWKAYVDGQETQIAIEDMAFQAVTVPSGTHTVAFRYAGFWEQARISFFGLIGARN